MDPPRPFPHAQPPGGSRALNALLGVGAGLLVAQLVVFPRLHHDVALYLTAAQDVLDGARPYVEVFDVNPPLILYLSAVPAAVADGTGWPLALCGLLFFAGLFGLAYGLLRAALRTLAGPDAAVAVALVGAAWLHLLALSHHSIMGFGQRDGVIGVLLLPLVAVRYARHAAGDGGPSVRVPTGLAVAAGVGGLVAIGLKPPYVLALVLAEGALALLHRRWPPGRTPEVGAFGAAGLVYALHFFAVPGMSAFYTHWLPFVARGYGAYDEPLSLVAGRLLLPALEWALAPPVVGLVACALVAGTAPFVRDRLFRLAGVFGVVALATAGLYVLQHKGWAYHLLPFHTAGLTALALAGAWGVRALARGWPAARWIPLTVVAVVALVEQPLLLVHAANRDGGWGAPPPSALADGLLARTAPGARVLVVSTDAAAGYPALAHTGRRAAGRYPFAFPLAFFFHDARGYTDLGPWADDEARYYADLLADVQRHRPALVLLDTTREGRITPSFFSVAAYLRQRGLYGDLATEYAPDAPIGRFEVLRRTNP